MSGGFFNYSQYHIEQIAQDLSNVIERRGTLRPKDNYMDEDGAVFPSYTPEVISELEKTVKLLKEAYIRVQAADYLLSDDSSTETYMKTIASIEKAL